MNYPVKVVRLFLILFIYLKACIDPRSSLRLIRTTHKVFNKITIMIIFLVKMSLI